MAILLIVKKTFINDAIFTAYKSLDEICTEWIYRKDAPYPVNIYGVNKLIERFYDSSKNIGFFFTLNQDLFIERHFNGIDAGLNLPGIRKIPDHYSITMNLPLKRQDFIHLPDDNDLKNESKFSATMVPFTM